MKTFMCHRSGCGRSFINPYNLKRHTAVKHLMTSVFTCTVCGKRLSSKQSLIEHGNLHSGEKPYKCPLCGIGFRFSSQISKHQRFHQDRPRMDDFLELKVRNI